MRALYILWAIVAAPLVIAILITPFAFMAIGVHYLFGVPLPEISFTKDQIQGVGSLWAGLFVLTTFVSLAKSLLDE